MNTRSNVLQILKRAYRRKQNLYHMALLIIVSFILYVPVLYFNFLIGWDDQWFVTNHYTANGLGWNNLYAILTRFYHGQYAPVNQLYYTMIYSLFGYNPGVFHIACVLIHLINVVLVYFLIVRVCLRVLNRSKTVGRTIAFFTAFLFAVLPLNIEPVAWVSASKVLLYALFYLAALLAYCHYLEKDKPVYFYLTLLFFILSFGAKEQAVLLPVCLLLFDFIYGRKLLDRAVWLEKLPFFVLALLFGLITIQSQVYYGDGRFFYPLYQRIPLAFYTLIEYFTKGIFPVNLSYLYPWPFLVGEKAPWWMWIYVAAVPAALYCLYDTIKRKWVAFGLLFFFIHILLVLNFLPLARYSFIADRYAYLSNAGICFLISTVLVLSYKEIKFKIPLAIVFFLYIGSLFLYSEKYLEVWKDAPTLKSRIEKTIESRPDFNQLKK